MKTIASTIELERLVTEYQQHLLNDAGLTVESCRVGLCHLRAFLTSQFKPKQELDLRQITPQTLLNYVLDQRQRLSLETLQSVTGSLRSFCRFLCFSGRVDRDLSPAVPSIADWVRLPQCTNPCWWARRLGVVHRFARFWHQFDNRVQVPPLGSFWP
jgi:integrase/recombinase XerD